MSEHNEAWIDYFALLKEGANILKLYQEGKSYKDIADQTGVSESTVIAYCNCYLLKKYKGEEKAV